MRHIPTAREYVDYAAVSSNYSADDLTVFLAVADTVDSLKNDPDSHVDLATLNENQRSAAMGILLALLAAHELDQYDREGVFE